jgi:hypothetical protein
MRRAGVDVWLTSALFDAAAKVVRKERARIFYAIMPAYVTRLLDRAGIRMELIESKLNTEDPFAAPIFEQFSLYWQRARPKLYHFPDAPAQP